MLVLLVTISSRLLNICEPEFPTYEVLDDYDLVHVQVLTRHGLRSSLHVHNKEINHIWNCKNIESKSFESSGRINVHVRHGKSVFLGDCFIGQLLGRGGDGLSRVGAHLRDIYITQMKFLPSDFTQSVVKFRTTATARTIHSQIHLVRGLYPNATRVNMQMADKQYDPWRRPDALCPRLVREISKWKKSEEFSSLTQPEFAALMSNATGASWDQVYDAVVPPYCDNITLPEIFDELTIERIAALKAQQMQFVFGHEDVYRHAFGFSAAELLNEMIDRINGETRTRFVHWSVHDGNINAFLGFYGHTTPSWPPFGSYIQIELVRNVKSGVFGVCCRYNGRIIRSEKFGNRKVVDLNVFRNYIEKVLPSLEECDLNPNKYNDEIVYDPITQ